MSSLSSQWRKLPAHAALLLTLTGTAIAQTATPPNAATGATDATPGASSPVVPTPMGSPMGAPMGAPMGSTADGAQPIEPLQRPVDAARQPVGGASGPVAAATSGTATALTDGPQPLNSAASVGADYRIGPNDLIEFDVFGVPDMKRTVRVNASGVVSLPLIGPVAVAGMTTGQAETMLAKRYQADYLQNPQVSLFIKEFTSQRITIEGAVARPGIYPVTGELTLLRALALAGGGAQYAMLTEVMLFRSGSSAASNTEMFDLEKIRNGEIPDPAINADDVIVVKRDPKRTALRDSFFGDLLSTLNPFK
ncbi:MAG: polysaccharide biosynthesis/export family protein [Burkholderiaceae bacterium]